jgi:hypothetical protein
MSRNQQRNVDEEIAGDCCAADFGEGHKANLCYSGEGSVR